MKRSDLVRSVQVRFQNMREQDASAIVDTVITAMTDAIAAGDRIEIRGFGVLTPRVRSPKVSVNPRTGEQMRVAAGRTILFQPSRQLTKKMSEA